MCTASYQQLQREEGKILLHPQHSLALRVSHIHEAMAPHSSTHAWKIPWTEGPGGLQSMGSLGVGHDWSNLAAAATHTWKTSHLRLAFLFLPPICSSTEGRLASISVVWVSPQSCQRSGSLDPVAILSSYLLWPVWSTQHWSLLLWCLLLPYHFHSLSGLHASGTVFVLLECPSQLASISGIFFVRWILTFSLLVSH